MLVLGPVSSAFDFLTFYALIYLFGASERMFQTGWFVESLATQALVIFVIRTRKAPWCSRPHPLLAGLSIGVVLVGLLIPLTPLAVLFGFVLLPPGFYVFLVAAVIAYLLLVEVVEQAYYRSGTH
jgi:Mg2+-importing ATPase